MKFIALKELPQGQQPGDVFEATEEVGAVFLSVGAAKRADEDTPDHQPPTRRRYQRRDLEAETS